ncbi:carbohydrate kinase [Glutamicibacter sp. MNS18]|uniref:carbohydrate kinase family protein n=1 Tax=Glutamicibacter sp. MNS18 TaxID=2989817 RepID=UPI002235AB72|nr:carbohydrate kinase [Glutamicibacter sp. MNS18]MCW4465409.1 carbohydrate kinase [Glutamicibacter sp. MNS18]
MSAIVMGESLVDVVAGKAHPGGSPLNVAVGLARLGHQVRFHTEFGTDTNGRLVAEHLAASSVAVAEGSVTERPTSVAVVEMDEHSNAHYSFTIQQQLPPLEMQHAPQLLHAGSIAAWIEPSGEQILRAFAQADTRTLRSYDPNLRPALVGDRPAALERIEHLMSLSHIVKLSDEDAQWLYPQLEEHQVLAHVAGLGPALVVLTCGERGALCWSSGTLSQLPAIPATVRDTIGAGDAFMSGLLHAVLDSPALVAALHARQPLDPVQVRRAVTQALCSAALTVARTGANPPWAEELSNAAGRHLSSPSA